jgi:hypothetical protein
MRWVGKTRTVRIATGDGDRVYHSIEDVPAELRKVVNETLEGPNSETVLIANQEAYERLSQQFRELPAGLRQAAGEAAERPARVSPSRSWKWGVVGLLSGIPALWLLWAWVTQNDTW